MHCQYYARSDDVAGCEFGDKVEGCTQDVCDSADERNWCCETCAKNNLKPTAASNDLPLAIGQLAEDE